MGSGTYSSSRRLMNATTRGYNTKTREEIFTQRQISHDMDPKKAHLRESRDSEEHPLSVPIILALDVTGSMGSVPHHLIKSGLPTLMETIIQGGINDPQVLFLAFGDHTCDTSPLQVGQFESSDELLDKWLETVWIEGNGGGNEGESYFLPWYFAAKHTVHDHWEKRQKKGYLFTVGDEPCLSRIPGASRDLQTADWGSHRTKGLQDIMGDGQYQDYTARELLLLASERYHVIHIVIRETSRGREPHTMDSWEAMMGNDVVPVQSSDQVPAVIARIVARGETGDMQTQTYEQPQPEAQETSELEEEPKVTL